MRRIIASFFSKAEDPGFFYILYREHFFILYILGEKARRMPDCKVCVSVHYHYTIWTPLML